MKSNLFDKIIGFFSPNAEFNRIRARINKDIAVRGYDAAKTYSTSDWVSATKTSANVEIAAARERLVQKSRDLYRNNPFHIRAVNTIVNNTVGAGILANIKGKKSQVKKLNELWRLVTDSTLCDSEGRNNFYGLQALAMKAIVDSGENLALKEITPEAPKVRLLESDYIKSDKDEGRIKNGIEFDNKGLRTKYYLYKTHPGDKGATDDFVTVPADRVAHAFKQDRPGQIRGVPWAHAVIETLKDIADYQWATIVSKKVAACFVGFITTGGSDSVLDPSDLKAKREAELKMEPGTFRYGGPGEDIKFSSPPPTQGYSEFFRESMRAVASGYGVSYEAMTGDYSQVNYSSGRMGHLEFRRNIDSWRWNVIIPQFCDPYFKWFLEWAETQGVNTLGVTVEWVPPAPTSIDPTKEIEALKREVRSGFKSYGQAVREQGLDPDVLVEEVAEWNQKFDDLKLSFDSDPRRLSNIGFAQPKDTLPLLSEAEYLKPEDTPAPAEGNNQNNDQNSQDAQSAASGDEQA
jgi:lambda family phage portal protein